MYFMGKPCSKRVSTLNLALKILSRNGRSVLSCFYSISILRPIRPVTMTKTVDNTVERKFRGIE